MAKSTKEDLRIAVRAHQSGHLVEADRYYQRALRIDPACVDALHLLGVLRSGQSRHDEATRLIERASRLRPGNATILGNLASALIAAGRSEDAARTLGQVIQLAPGSVAALANLALALNKLGRHAEALGHAERALEIGQASVEACIEGGVAAATLGHRQHAIGLWRQGLGISPDHPILLGNLGGLLVEERRLDEAIALLARAVALRPEWADARLNLGIACWQQQRVMEAQGEIDRAVALAPDSANARWAAALCRQPPLLASDAEHALAIGGFSRALDDLGRFLDAGDTDAGFEAVGSIQPFFLAYHEADHRELLSRYGDLCARSAARWLAAQPPAQVASDRTRPVVGIVSSHTRDHAVWHPVLRGWLLRTERRDFDFVLFHFGLDERSAAELAAAGISLLDLSAQGTAACVDAIRSAHPLVLLYPEIGMHSMTTRLASLRLSPVQAVGWGHPETSGLPTLDYYLSGEAFEPPGAESLYREELVRLPGLGSWYEPHDVQAIEPDFSALGLDPSRPLVLCPGTMLKYGPRQDAVLVGIAAALPEVQFAFFRSEEGIARQVRERLGRALIAAGREPEQVLRFLPWQSRPAWHGLMQGATMMLDTIGFSGFNTAMQAIECGLPIVAWRGDFMRGRFAASILDRLGLAELVAESESRYVQIAIRLVSDVSFREAMSTAIVERRRGLYRNAETIAGFQTFLASAIARARRGGAP